MATRPTKNPRIAFVPSDAVHAILVELSELSKESRSALVSGYMDDLVPVIRGQLEAFRKIAAHPEEVRQYVHDLADEARAQIDQAELSLDEPKQPRKRKVATSGPT
jgi:hypothetical protein